MHSTVKQAFAVSILLTVVVPAALSNKVIAMPPAKVQASTHGKQAVSSTKTTPTGGSWIQDRTGGEQAMHMPDSSGSALLAAKLNSEKDLAQARTLLRKSASELQNLPSGGGKATMQREIAKLTGDFAFLQATEQAGAKKMPYSEQDADATLQLKGVSDDYAVLVPAVEKHLGENDPQVIGLKQLQDAFKRAFEDHEELLKQIAEKKRRDLMKSLKNNH